MRLLAFILLMSLVFTSFQYNTAMDQLMACKILNGHQ